MVTISWAVTACVEHVELERLLEQLSKHVKETDEIIIQLDTTATEQVKSLVTEYISKGIKVIEFSLNKDFASFKNNLKLYCTKEWIIYLDADEYLSEGLIENIHEILTINKGLVDVIAVPRINIVDHIGLFHIMKWKWHPSKIEKPEFIKEKVLDLDNPQDRDHYELLKKGGFLIEEIPSD